MRVRWAWAALVFATAGVILSAPGMAAAADGAALYQERCAGCHGASGEGSGSIPPLADNPAVLNQEAPRSVIAEGRGMMPGFSSLTEEELTALVDYLAQELNQGAGPDAGGTPAGEEGDTPPGEDGAPVEGGTPAEPGPKPAGDSEQGRRLFLGSAGFENGGASCVSCHAAGGAGDISGGSLARDLTDLDRRMGSDAIYASLAQPAFPLMNEIYADRPLTEQERADLAAFFAALASEPDAGGSPLSSFWPAGLAGFALLFVLMAAFWPRHGTSAVQRLRALTPRRQR
ncbi:MAG: hypothetical protein Kow00122_15240 [Thermoleophilia bacterium]